MLINKSGIIETDAATIALFDPAVIMHRKMDNNCWWAGDPSIIDEVRNGVIALIGTGGDGCFRIRIQSGEVDGPERPYARLHSSQCVHVVSGNLIIGKGECLPGCGNLYPKVIEGSCFSVDLPNGNYHVLIYEIDWMVSGEYWNADEPIGQGAPSDYVMLINKGPTEIVVPKRSHERDDTEFAFESSDRHVGPIVGQILRTKVYKGRDGLVLNECGPCLLKPIPQNWNGVRWLDIVLVRVLRVNLQEGTMVVDIVHTV